MLATAYSADVEAVHADYGHVPGRPQHLDVLAQSLLDGPIRMFESKEHLFRDGDAVSNVYQVEIGHVCIYKMMSDGRRQVIDFAYPGDLIALGSIGAHAADAMATTRTRVRCLSIAAMRQVMKNDARLGIKLYEAMSRELLAARELLFTVTQRTATERVAAFLIALSRRNERNGEDADEFVLPMTRNDIADFLGLTIETVSRTFTKLRVDGLIGLAQSVLVTIVDHEALAGIADGNRQ